LRKTWNDWVMLVDTSVWIAHTFTAHPNHRVAVGAVAGATGKEPAAFCRATEQSFLRLATTPAIHRTYRSGELTNEDALRILEGLMAMPNVAFCDEPAGIVAQWHALARRETASPKLWMDAYLAAFAIAGGLTFVTLDADFQHFEPSGLKLQFLPGS
jgi:uncharacterized protein